jgi:hypothetical protein
MVQAANVDAAKYANGIGAVIGSAPTTDMKGEKALANEARV